MGKPPAYHAMTRAGRELFRAAPICGKAGVTSDRLVIPSTASLVARITCKDCRRALNWPAELDAAVTALRLGLIA